MAYETGGLSRTADANFMSTDTIIKIDQEGKLQQVYGSQRITGLAELFGMKKSTTSQEYYWWEQNRIMPKIKATSPGGAAGAGVTFTLNAASYTTTTFNSPSMYNSTTTKNNLPVRKGDLIMIKPASGTVSASTVVKAIVWSVNAGAGTFVAYPMNSADAIPVIGTADEVVVFSNAHGEGSAQPQGMVTRVTKRNNNTHIFKENYNITGTADGLKTYFTYKGQQYYSIMGEEDTYKRFLNFREMGYLISENTSNATLQDLYAGTDGTPFATTKGMIPNILTLGSNYDYTGVTGMTISDFEDYVVTLNTRKAAKRNLLSVGIELDIDLDRELRGEFKNGGILYGTFSMSEEKAVSLEFKSFSIGGYTFDKKCFEAFNDEQTFGAAGFGFKSEGMVIPAEKMADAKTGEMLDPITVRYLQGKKASREMRVVDIDLMKQGDNGDDAFQIRYLSEGGLETPGMNRFGYLKKA